METEVDSARARAVNRTKCSTGSRQDETQEVGRNSRAGNLTGCSNEACRV